MILDISIKVKCDICKNIINFNIDSTKYYQISYDFIIKHMQSVGWIYGLEHTYCNKCYKKEFNRLHQ